MNYKELPIDIRKNIYFKTSENMSEIDDGEIQTIITSPPYWNLKDYNHPDQIGYGETYEKYQERLDKVWSECKRVLDDTGTMWIVVDKLWRKRRIVHIPFHIAQHCQKIGFYLKDILIWNKPTAIAGMYKRNLLNKHESVIFLSKNKNDYKLNLDKMELSKQHDFNEGKLTDLWRFVVKAGSLRKTPDHKAPFPIELIERIIGLSTDRGDIIIDPFLGSGTTLCVALSMNRRCIGYEINPDFKETIFNQIKNFNLITCPKIERDI